MGQNLQLQSCSVTSEALVLDALVMVWALENDVEHGSTLSTATAAGGAKAATAGRPMLPRTAGKANSRNREHSPPGLLKQHAREADIDICGDEDRWR